VFPILWDGLFMMQPYRRGRIPVVLVHGKASSSARWAELFNELEGDPRIRERFQFWVYLYDTGNPIGYSAGRLRAALTNTVQELDPDGKDPALRRMVVIGHSQGGLLCLIRVVPRLGSAREETGCDGGRGLRSLR
jgi:pimeloyl-ACP methyl ester carboxylesterase